MALSAELLSNFVKAVNKEEKPKQERIVYGTAIKQGDSVYVRLDGSELLTPVSTTVDVTDKERVTVMIKNHTAVITGNITSPAAKTSVVQSLSNEVSTIKQTSNQVEVTVTDSSGTVSSIINPETVSIRKLDTEGHVTSGFYYDTDVGEFKFVGAGEFHASDGTGSYIRIEDDEIVLYDDSGIDRLRIGFVGDGTTEFPYVLLAKDETGTAGGLIKRFSNGVWFGNAVPKEDTGAFSGKPYASGLFVDILENKAYIVNGDEMRNLYTGEAVARFA